MNSNDQQLIDEFEELIEDTEQRNDTLENAISDMIKNKTSNGEKIGL
ncbi:hypothetical protein THOM_1788 [Trachipleistophora hominis]|uniref:Uncharacterized protein n=1 Tax=Trachipleistophora hominis TaxID=72359 RepID=L7JW68_TRAHO|nr:hypothetical protein THOM_1788 [Trachipleistophora hominis]